jgi:hypothetical protein
LGPWRRRRRRRQAEVGKEGEDGVGISGRLEVGELPGGLEGMVSGEAAGADQVLLDGELQDSGGNRGEESAERGDGIGGGVRREEMGEDAASQAEHCGRRRHGGGAGGLGNWVLRPAGKRRKEKGMNSFFSHMGTMPD